MVALCGEVPARAPVSHGFFQNAPANEYNPSLSGNLALSIHQPLLQGFGLATNRRAITIARNNLTVADLNFKTQVIATVKNVIDLYWDLVSLNDNLKAKQKALGIAEKLYQDNRKRLAIGAIAPIDIVQAEAGAETAQLDLRQARAAYETAVKARKLQEQTFAGTERKYQMGTATFTDVALLQRDVVTSQSAETNALNGYIKARNNLDMVLGRLLEINHVDIQEAYKASIR